MNADQNRAKSIYLNAAELALQSEREAYLNAECADNAALRREVEDLLKHHEPAAAFLESPAAVVAATGDLAAASQVETRTVSAHECPGTVIGPYKLLQQIGEGGMGTVYMAEQLQPIQRKVALKIIKAGMDTRQVIARFEAERQALAMMDHVNIARVFDGGATENGLPYFVMELVHGVPITKYCDDNHLTPRERLELFVPVCQAIQHAHQKGIIHRDIKPSNVMITLYDGKPVPKVIDFGVAKATEQKLTERTLFTQYGTMVGTLEYMSPEQAEMSALGVDTRSDIYSLGVLLYELLTGNTPLTHLRMREVAYAEILRMIKEEEPPKPSTRLSDSGEALASISANRHTEPGKLTKLMRGELDWIVMKTLEKDRNRRYETANGFAMDVQRYLADEQVQACPPSAMYRFRKFARRNKRALATAALLGAMLLVLAGSLGWMASDRAARRARTAVEVQQFLKRADSLYEDNKLPEAVAEVQKAHGLLEAGGGDEGLRRQVRQWGTDLDTAVKLDEIRLEWYDHRDDDRKYADFARAFREYGIDVEALATEEAAARVAASRIKVDLVLTLGSWAESLRSDARPENSARRQRLLAISRAADPDPWRVRYETAYEAKDVRTLRELADGADLARFRTRILAYLGTSLEAAGDAEAAVAFLRKAQRQHSGDFSINFNLAFCLGKLKPSPKDEIIGFCRVVTALRPQSPGARRLLGNALAKNNRFDEAIAEYREAIRVKPNDAIAHDALGLALSNMGLHDEAIAEYREAIRLKPDYALAHGYLGFALRKKGLVDEAIAEYREAIRLKPDNAFAHRNLSNALQQKGLSEEAIAEAREAVRLNPDDAFGHRNLSNALQQKGVLEEAIAEAREAVRLEPDSVAAHIDLGVALGKKGLVDERIAAYREAIRLKPDNALAHSNLGLALSKKGLVDEAIAEAREAVRLAPDDATWHANLSLALKDKGLVDEAIAEAREAVRLAPDSAWAHDSLGSVLENLDEAVACHRKAIELDPKSANAHYNLGTELSQQGKLDEAIVYLRRAIELDPKNVNAWNNRGLAYERLAQLDKALADFSKAIDLDPKSARAHSNLGDILRKQGKPDEAIAAYREAVRLDPGNACWHINLGDALSKKGLRDEAIAANSKAIELDPKNASAWNNRGADYGRLGQRDKALADYSKAIELNPKNALFWTNRGLTYERLNELDKALSDYSKAIELDPKFAPTWSGRGWVLQRLNQLEKALADHDKAIELDPKYAPAWSLRGSIYWKLGRHDEAIAAYRKAIELDPKDANARIWLGNALMQSGWGLANNPDPKLRDPKRAVALSKEAVELAPLSVNAWQHLGWVQYRAGNWQASIEALEKSCKLQEGGTGDYGQWIVMSLAHGKLANEKELPEPERTRHQAEARRWYDQSVKQIGSRWSARPSGGFDQVLWDFRAEATELLGVKEKQK
jgi:eukaryotic-like serine/threonine-protein kinase